MSNQGVVYGKVEMSYNKFYLNEYFIEIYGWRWI
jgi:hypothetical protein